MTKKPWVFNVLLTLCFMVFVVAYWVTRSPAGAPALTESTLATPAQNFEPGQPIEEVSQTYHVQVYALKQQIQATPGDTVSLSTLARLLHDAHRFEEAAAYYKQLLKYAPKDEQGWLDLANVYAALEQWDAAIDASESLLAFRPAHVSAMYNLGAIHANLGRYDQARTWWTKVQNQDTDPTLASQAAQNLQQISL